MIPPEHRHGSYGQLDISVEDDRLLCCMCGRWYRNLHQHARLSHSLTADEYRRIAGLNRTTRLVSPGYSARMRESTAPVIQRLRADGKLKHFDEDPEKLRVAHAAAALVLHAEGLAPEGRRRQRESWGEEERQIQAERTRQRNLSGELRASPDAIRRGIRAAEGTCEQCGTVYQRTGTHQRLCPTCRQGNDRRLWRESAERRRQRESAGDDAAPRRADPLANVQPRPVVCARCGTTFEAHSHREKYCVPCRGERDREYQREYARQRRARMNAE